MNKDNRKCPGSKIRSDGKGRGNGIGNGKGPIGRMGPSGDRNGRGPIKNPKK